MRSFLKRRLKGILFLLALGPALYLIVGVLTDGLGANPIETITRTLGDWALYYLLITLSISPLVRLSKQGWLMPLRRMFGLYSFSYATLHLSSYIVLDQFFYWPEIWADILERPYITIGMLSYLALLPLAITSIKRVMRRMGGQRWQALHRLVYLIAVGVVVHYYLMVKADVSIPLLCGFILSLLLGYRLKGFLQNRLRGGVHWSAPPMGSKRS